MYFVKNPFGTFFLHGVADSFQYDYYYGYEGDKFGLAKSLLRDEQYDASGNMSIVYSVDDKNVSEEVYKEEAALWKPASEANENYVLTYYNTEERDKVWDLIDDTCKSLQQHSEELAITRERRSLLQTLMKRSGMLAAWKTKRKARKKHLREGKEKVRIPEGRWSP